MSKVNFSYIQVKKSKKPKTQKTKNHGQGTRATNNRSQPLPGCDHAEEVNLKAVLLTASVIKAKSKTSGGITLGFKNKNPLQRFQYELIWVRNIHFYIKNPM